MATVRTNISRTFSDLDLNFTKHPVRKDVNTLTAERAVIGAVKNLILTNHYERPFQPDLGSNLRRMLFENMDNIQAAALEREIGEVINNFEPRASVKNIAVNPKYDENGYEVELTFFIQNLTAPVTINFFLERIR
tara:strand:- start:827 stop:1231 length:405 start_codon:yes stop_codon:yes gene_type:complete